MRSIYKDFVKHAEAKDLQALGFDDKCIGTIDQTEYMHLKGTSYPARGAMCYDTVACSTYAQAFRWFREKHNLFGNICFNQISCKSYYIVFGIRGKTSDSEDSYETYEEAELECLKRLIEIVKKKSNG